jgi:SAM-dependent methyltransferase
MSAQPIQIADYDEIAWFYNRHWSTHYHPWAVEILNRTLLRKLTPGSRILDLCCGNGVLARELSKRGYRVTGLDISSGMLAYARINAPLAQFLCADARRFDFGPVFDGAISTFDSLNHMLAGADLLKVFENARKSLRPGATLVFDVNLEDAFTVGWKDTFTSVDQEHACFIRGNYDSDTKLAETAVTIFRQDGYWKRNDFTLRQRFYPADEIMDLLVAAGFERAECLNAATDLGVPGPFSEGRGVLIATTPQRTGPA